MERFFDLNSSPNNHFEYFEESFKQTMFDHDSIFKKQVHGLYAVQKSLMTIDSNYTGCEATFHMKRSFTGNHSARFLINKLFPQEEDDEVELNLSLTIGKSINKRRKSCKKKLVYPSSIEIIDLEESSGIGSSENGVNLYKDPLKVDSSCSKRESLVNGVMHQEWSSSNQGSNELYDVKKTKLMDFDLNKEHPDESFHSNEPSSNLTDEKEINISKETEEKVKKDSDYEIQKAAHSLVSISLQQFSTTNQYSESKSGSNETKIKKSNPRRSSSIDSYESLVLKLEESNVDEECVTSKAFEVKELCENENRNGIKLKRGRRMKDFQKDILPTLSALSRHEIWEDIKILEGVIRSREYKRLQKAKTGNGEDWFMPVKSKRSKINCAGQKNCLPKKK